MEIHLTPQQEVQLSQMAGYAGTNAEELVKEAALRLLEQDAEFRAGVRRGMEQAERGELIDHEDVKDRMARLLRR